MAIERVTERPGLRLALQWDGENVSEVAMFMNYAISKLRVFHDRTLYSIDGGISIPKGFYIIKDAQGGEVIMPPFEFVLFYESD